MAGFSTYGAAQGAAFTYDWGAEIDRAVRNEQLDTQAAEIKRQKVDALTNMTLEKEALTERNKAPLKEHYDNLSNEMGNIFTEYDDPFSDPEAMKRMKQISAQYADNDILRADAQVIAQRDAMEKDRTLGILDDEDYNNMTKAYNDYANGISDIPFVYSRPTYQNTSTVLGTVAAQFSKTMDFDWNSFEDVSRYTDEQFDTMMDVVFQNGDLFDVMKKNFIKSRRGLGQPDEFNSGMELNSEMSAWMKDNLKQMFPEQRKYNGQRYDDFMSNKSSDFAGPVNDPFTNDIVLGKSKNDPEVAESIATYKKGSVLPLQSNGAVSVGFGKNVNPIYAITTKSDVTIAGYDRIETTPNGDYLVASATIDSKSLFNAALNNASNVLQSKPGGKIKLSELEGIGIDPQQIETLQQAIQNGETMYDAFGLNTQFFNDRGVPEPEINNVQKSWKNNADPELTEKQLAYLIASRNISTNPKDGSLSKLFSDPNEKMRPGDVRLQGIRLEAKYTPANVNEYNKKASVPQEIKMKREQYYNQRGETRRLANGMFLNASEDNIPNLDEELTITDSEGRNQSVGVADFLLNYAEKGDFQSFVLSNSQSEDSKYIADLEESFSGNRDIIKAKMASTKDKKKKEQYQSDITKFEERLEWLKELNK